MIIIDSPTSIKTIQSGHNDFFETMVKIVVDIEKQVIALNAELHADLEMLMLENESGQQNLWGANLYFQKPNFIEYTSLINIRPAQGNKSMEVQDPDVRRQMQQIVQKLILW